MSARVSLVVLTGAGISADSGLSTFRGPPGSGGLWEGHRVEDVATPRAWARDPALVWRFYQMRRARLVEVEPNAAHAALVRLQRGLEAAGHAFTLVTQNVDGLHERAGSAALEMHGALRRLACEGCGRVVLDLEHLDPERFLPCAACGFPRLRPDVVWFEEVPRHLDLIAEAVEACTHFLAVGTSGVVHPAAGLLQLARENGARTFVSGLERPENLHPADLFLPGRAVDVLPRLVERWLAEGIPAAAPGPLR